MADGLQAKQKSSKTVPATNIIKMERPEIMAPVGSFESLRAAINAGADSIYFGVQQLNMRARSAHNFTLEELKEIAETCNKEGIKSYVTLNTLLYQHDLELMKKILTSAKNAGITAAILQDIAAIQFAKEIGLQIHASTQLSISNFESVKFYAQFADTIVLAREVDLDMIKNICDKIKEEKIKGPAGELVRIEVFVHGALCIAQSGRCQMSLLQTNTSAQRGACLHECRKKYRIIDEETNKEMIVENNYVLSPQDLCCLPFLDKMVNAGISVFKIEGRGRSAQYVDVVVRAYREAADSIIEGTFTKEKIENWIKQLRTVYNRDFCDGYYLGKTLPEWSGKNGNQSTVESIFVGLISHHFPKAKVAEIQIQAHELKKGDNFVIMGKTTGVVYGTVKSMKIEENFVENSGKPSLVTIPIDEMLRKNDRVFLLRKREDETT